VVDTWSREIVGWAMADNVRAELIVEAPRWTVAVRRPPHGVARTRESGGCDLRAVVLVRAE
jgi:transposase InsO family protein